MKDARGHGSNGFGRRTPQPSVSNAAAIEALKHALIPPAPLHDSMSAGSQLVRSMRGAERGDRRFADNPITTLKPGFGRRGAA